MYLSRLYIKGFRSIAELDLSFQPGMNVIVGRNNSGKSNIVRALDIVLGESSPTYAKSELITEKDFRSTRTTDAEGTAIDTPGTEFFIWCELVRETGEALDYDALYACPGFYVYSEIAEWIGNRPSKRPIRVPRGDMPKDYEDYFNISEDENSEKDYINPKLKNQKTFEHQFDHKYRFAYGLRVTKKGDRINRDLRFFYREGDAKDWVMSFRAPIRNELLQSAIIPSFRDPDRQLRSTSWTWYGKLLRALTRDKVDSAKLKAAFEDVRKLADECFSEARDAINASSLHVAFPDTELFLQFSADSRADLYKGCAIYVDDGQRSLLAEKGSGIQSAIIIGLFSYYTHHINTTSSALLCIEEPELYLHPHAQRVISSRLEDFVDASPKRRNQVILTTHAPEFVAPRNGVQMITLVRRTPSGTGAFPVETREFRDLLLGIKEAELFFADGVILCEGLDDHVIRAALDHLVPGTLDAKNISVIGVGSKDRFSAYVKLLSKLDIPMSLVADFDYLLRDRDADGCGRYDATPHESLGSLPLDALARTDAFGTTATEVGKRIQKLRSRIRAQQERLFYTAKALSELPDDIRAETQSLLSDLHQGGIHILAGQIEDVVLEKPILHKGKFDQESVFRLHAAKGANRPIGELIDVEALRPLADKVFGGSGSQPSPVTPAAVPAEPLPLDEDDDVPF